MKKVIKFTGREEEMTFEEVAEQFKYFVKGQANKYKSIPNLYFEDLESLGMFGLWKAFKRYDGSTNFITYASYFVRGEILRGFKRNIKLTRENNYIKNVDSLDAIIRSEGKERDLYTLKGEVDKNIDFIPERLFIEKFKSNLNDDELKMMDYILYKNETQKQLAEELKITQPHISRKVRNLLTRIKAEYSGGNW